MARRPRRRECAHCRGLLVYGPDQTLESAMQWKPVDFYAVYVGSLCLRGSLVMVPKRGLRASENTQFFASIRVDSGQAASPLLVPSKPPVS